MAEPTEPHSQGAKDHRAAPHLHGDPANCQPADAIRAHQRYSTRGMRAGQGAQARPAHAAVDARRPAWKAAPRTARQDCSDLHRHLEQDLKPAMATFWLARQPAPGRVPVMAEFPVHLSADVVVSEVVTV